jgi:hypothetical protein
MAEAIRRRTHPSWTIRIEVPVAPDDARAADLVLEGPREILHIEIERSLVDIQAQVRSAQLKRDALANRLANRRDSTDTRPVRLILAVPDTTTARRRLAPARELLDRTLPASTRRIWDVIQSGRTLQDDGMLFVRDRG